MRSGPPAPISIPILLEPEGWVARCPDCGATGGPYDARDKGARWRGRHLTDKHGASNFGAGLSPIAAKRHAQQVKASRRLRHLPR